MNEDRVAGGPTLRTLYVRLGTELSNQSRFTEAVDAFRKGLREVGEAPDSPTIRLQIANSLEKAGIRSEALRAYLEVTLESPQLLDGVLEDADRLLDLEVVSEQRDWIIDEWVARMARMQWDASSRSRLDLFVGRIHLFLGAYEAALELFQKAMEVAPEDRLADAAQILSPEALPPVLSTEGMDGNTHYLLARLNRALGRSEQALREVDRALDLGLTGETEYPEAPAQWFKAELLTAAGEDEAAAEWFYDAGRSFSWRNEHDSAVKAFARAVQLKPSLQAAYWYWADSLRMRVLPGDTSSEAEAGFSEALDTWEKGYAFGLPNVEFAWAHNVRALILEGIAKFRTNKSELWLEAIVNLERALVLSSQNADALAFVGRFYRALDKDAAAMQATDAALHVDEENVNALMERGAALANVADDQALEVLDRYRQKVEWVDAWAEGLEGYVLTMFARYNDALPFVERSKDAAPTDVWSRFHRARAYRLVGRVEEALADFRWAFDKSSAGGELTENDRLHVRGWAAYQLGDYAAATDIFRGLLADPDTDALELRLNLAYCALALGNSADADQWFTESLSLFRNRRQALDAIVDLTELGNRLAGDPKQEESRGRVERCRRAIEGKATELHAIRYDQEAAALELQRMVDQGASDPIAPEWLAAQAGLARIHAEAGRWEEVASLYQTIVQRHGEGNGARFPEARGALSRSLREMASASEAAGQAEAAIGQLRRAMKVSSDPEDQSEARRQLVDLLTETGQVAEATVACERGLALAARAGNHLEQAAFEARLGLLQALQADVSGARDHFRLSIELRSVVPDPNITGDVLAVLSGNLDQFNSRARSHAISEALALLTDDRTTDEVQRRRLLSARLDLSRRISPFGTNLTRLGSETEIEPVPISIQADSRLFPQGAQTPEVIRLLDFDIDQMRDGIQGTTGVRVPGVRISPRDDLFNGGYELVLREIPFARGIVRIGEKYCPKSSLALGLEGRIEINPLEGMDGLWLSGPALDTGEKAGLELWDVYLFMLRHLEAVLRRHLATFLGVQEMRDMLEGWESAANPDQQSVMSSALPDGVARMRFLQVLSGLVRERVPVANLGVILNSFAEVNGDRSDVQDVIEHVRLALRPELPGNVGPRELIELSPDFERALASWIQERNGKKFLAIPATDAERLLSELSRQLADRPSNRVALVIREPGLRPFVWRLVEGVRPTVSVVAGPELVADAVTQRAAAKVAPVPVGARSD